MQEHLIPQDISNYKFHIIGELDLVQFCEIIGGVILGVIIYRLGWPSYIKWPIILLVVSTGLIAAFIPISDRPLTHWVKAFFKCLFAPTKFYWRKQIAIPSFFNFTLSASRQAALNETTVINPFSAKQYKTSDYFTTIKHSPNQVDQLEIFNPDNLNKITADIKQELSPTTKAETKAPIASPTKMALKPNIKNQQMQRQRQIIAPSQKTLEQFLSNITIFKPKQATAAITTVNDSPDSFKPSLQWPTSATQPLSSSSDIPPDATPSTSAITKVFPPPLTPTPPLTTVTPPTLSNSSTAPTASITTPTQSPIIIPSLTPTTDTTLTATSDPAPSPTIIIPSLTPTTPTASITTPTQSPIIIPNLSPSSPTPPATSSPTPVA